jgi:hypothetical protein
MPEKKTVDEARKAKREGKSPSTQAGAFVHEEIEHIREGKHGARSAKQVIAIGLAKARRAGVDLPPPPPAQANALSVTRSARTSAQGRSLGHRAFVHGPRRRRLKMNRHQLPRRKPCPATRRLRRGVERPAPGRRPPGGGRRREPRAPNAANSPRFDAPPPRAASDALDPGRVVDPHTDGPRRDRHSGRRGPCLVVRAKTT